MEQNKTIVEAQNRTIKDDLLELGSDIFVQNTVVLERFQAQDDSLRQLNTKLSEISSEIANSNARVDAMAMAARNNAHQVENLTNAIQGMNELLHHLCQSRAAEVRESMERDAALRTLHAQNGALQFALHKFQQENVQLHQRYRVYSARNGLSPTGELLLKNEMPSLLPTLYLSRV